MSGNLLGKSTPPVTQYTPGLLHAISRDSARQELGLSEFDLPFVGQDLWHAWELSWLNAESIPRVAVGRFRLPCESPNLIESKSFKLYLNSLNFSVFNTLGELTECLSRDLSAVAGSTVQVEVLALNSPEIIPTPMPGLCIDQGSVTAVPPEPSRSLLKVKEGEGGIWHSHLLRSLCPVTGQPDWASLVVSCAGVSLDEDGLLQYVLSYRQHQEFHEQCVERIYCDILAAANPAELSVQALYSRRGGLDINPWRSSSQSVAPVSRSLRQ